MQMGQGSFYTWKKDPDAEAHISNILSRLHDNILHLSGARLIYSVLLGGNYGRGEGGLTLDITNNIYLYNDFIFFVVTRNISRAAKAKLSRELSDLGRFWSEKLQTRVAFDFICNLDELEEKGRTSLLLQDVRAGSVVLLGDPSVQQMIPEVDASQIPKQEALYLLVVSGVGLTDAFLHGQNVRDLRVIDALNRKVNKTVFACGDALLLANGKFAFPRMQRFRNLQAFFDENVPVYFDSEAFLNAYQEAIQLTQEPHFVMQATLHSRIEFARDLWKGSFLAFISTISGKEVYTGDRAVEVMRKLSAFDRGFLRNVKDNLNHFFTLQNKSLFISPQMKVVILLCEILFTEHSMDQRNPDEIAWQEKCYQQLFHCWRKFF